MTSPSGEWGPNLYRYLEAYWQTNGTTRGTWCETHSLQPSTVMRWEQGNQPRLEQMITVANAVGIAPLDVLLIAGVIDKADTKRVAPAAPTPTTPEVAIREDDTLTEWQRKHLLDFLASIRDVGDRMQRETEPKVRGRKSRS